MAYWMYNENNNLNALYLIQSTGRYIGRAERLIPPKCLVMKQIQVHSTTETSKRHSQKIVNIKSSVLDMSLFLP